MNTTQYSISLSKKTGFTIVELLIVVVVIALLAAIVVVGYNGITSRATQSTLQAEVSQAARKFETLKISNGVYPATLNDAGLSAPSGATIVYQATDTTYCYSLTKSGVSYKISNDNTSPQTGVCTVVISCPTNYVIVPGNSTFGTTDFCVMKYEAKITGNDVGTTAYNSSMVPDSRATGTPWTNISQANAITEAQTACAGCHLITEAEWMTIAANILSVASNWSGGAVGSGYVFQGHTDNAPANTIAASTTDTLGYTNTGNTAGETAVANGVEGNTQKRTHILSNGSVIWDFSGNAAEWTAGTITGGQPTFGAGVYGWTEWNNSTLQLNNLPATSRPASIGTTAGTYSSVQGIGQMYTSNPVDTRAYFRGGFFSSGSFGGILGLSMAYQPSGVLSSHGFRVTK